MTNKNGRSKKPVVCVETGRVYDSIAQAATAVGITASSVSLAVNGLYQTAAGYHWEYAEPGVIYQPRAVIAERTEPKPKKAKRRTLHGGPSMTIEEVQKEAERRSRETGRRVRYAHIQIEETVAMIRQRDKLEKLKRKG